MEVRSSKKYIIKNNENVVCNVDGEKILPNLEGLYSYRPLDDTHFLLFKKRHEKMLRGGSSRVTGYDLKIMKYDGESLSEQKEWTFNTDRHFNLNPFFENNGVMIVQNDDQSLSLYDYKKDKIISKEFTRLSDSFCGIDTKKSNSFAFEIAVTLPEDSKYKGKVMGFVEFDGKIKEFVYDQNGDIYNINANDLDTIIIYVQSELKYLYERDRMKEFKQESAKTRALKLLNK